MLLVGLQAGQAQNPADSLYRQLRHAQPPTTIGIYLDLSAHYFHESLDSVKKYSTRALTLAQKMHDTVQKAYANEMLGDYYNRSQQFDSALIAYQQVVPVYDSLIAQDTTKLLNLYQKMSNMYAYMADLDQALEYLYALRQLAQGTQFTRFAAAANSNIGSIFMYTGQYEKAWSPIKQALAINLRAGNDEYAAVNYNNLGEIFRTRHQPDSALEYFQQALTYAQQANYPKLIASAKANIGVTHGQEGRYEKALRYMQEAMQLARQQNDAQQQAQFAAQLGLAWAQKDYSTKALTIYQQGLQSARKLNLLDEQVQIHKNLIYLLTRQLPDTTLHYYFAQYEALNDSLLKQQNRQRINQLEVAFNTRQQRQEKVILEKENKLMQAGMERQQRFILFSISFSILLLGALALLYRNSQLQQKAARQARQLLKQEKQLAARQQEKQALEKQHWQDIYKRDMHQKSQELMAITANLVSKNRLLADIKALTKQNNCAPQEVVQLINQNIDPDMNWNHFRLSFEKVHPHFFIRLKNQYPNLTENEIKLAAFLRMRLTTRQIADIMGISDASVSKNRQRLRKKLDLPSGADLPAHMAKIDSPNQQTKHT